MWDTCGCSYFCFYSEQELKNSNSCPSKVCQLMASKRVATHLNLSVSYRQTTLLILRLACWGITASVVVTVCLFLFFLLTIKCNSNFYITTMEPRQAPTRVSTLWKACMEGERMQLRQWNRRLQQWAVVLLVQPGCARMPPAIPHACPGARHG